MDSNSIARLDLRRRNIRPPLVQRDVAMQDELACLSARVGETEAVHDVVEPHLEHPQQVLARHPRLPLGGLEVLVELSLEDAVDVAGLLLFFELQAELALLAAASIAGRSAWRRRPPLDG